MNTFHWHPLILVRELLKLKGRKLIHSATNHEKIPEAKVYPLQYVVKISAPVLVIKMECSNCAAGLPSADTAVQLSGQVMQSMLPSVRIGSAEQQIQTFKRRFMDQLTSFTSVEKKPHTSLARQHSFLRQLVQLRKIQNKQGTRRDLPQECKPIFENLK